MNWWSYVILIVAFRFFWRHTVVREMTFKVYSRSLSTAQFNRPHISFNEWSVAATCLSCNVSRLFDRAVVGVVVHHFYNARQLQYIIMNNARHAHGRCRLNDPGHARVISVQNMMSTAIFVEQKHMGLGHRCTCIIPTRRRNLSQNEMHTGTVQNQTLIITTLSISIVRELKFSQNITNSSELKKNSQRILLFYTFTLKKLLTLSVYCACKV